MPGPQDPRLATVRLAAGPGAFTIAGLSPEERDAVLAAWSRCSPVILADDTAPVDVDRAAFPSWAGFHEAAVSGATSAAIHAGRGSRLMLHAACLADPATGAAIALAAESGTGKTTATRRLGPSYSYLTDETAIIDPATLAVTPYPKPLSLLGPSGQRPKTQVGPDDLGLGPTVLDARLRRIGVLDRVRDPQGPVEARAEPLPLLEALHLLLPQTSSLSSLPRGLVTLCRLIDSVGGVQRMSYAQAEDLRPLIDDLLASPPVAREPEWEPLTAAELAPSAEGPRSQESAPDDGAVGRALVRVGIDDGILTTEGALALLHDQELLVLEGLGPALWLMLEEPLTEAQMLERFAAEGALPSDAGERVAAAVASLESHGLVVGSRV